MPATWKKLAYADDVIPLTAFTAAHTMLASNVANVAVPVALGANEMIGRLGTANIANLTAANVRTILGVLAGGGIPTVADAAARVALTPALADLVFQVDELSYYGCTVVA